MVVGSAIEDVSLDITQYHERTVPELSQTTAQPTEQHPTFGSEHALKESADKEGEMIEARRRFSLA